MVACGEGVLAAADRHYHGTLSHLDVPGRRPRSSAGACNLGASGHRAGPEAEPTFSQPGKLTALATRQCEVRVDLCR